MNTRLLVFALALAFCLLSPAAYAQVTIGTDEAPEKGALLQLKDVNDVKNGEATATTGGLLLPRVNLTDRAELYPFFDTDYNKGPIDEIKLKHTGLVVYNLSDTNGFIPGLYHWTGAEWVTYSSNKVLLNETEDIRVKGYGVLGSEFRTSEHFKSGNTEYTVNIPGGLLKEKSGYIDFFMRAYRSTGVGAWHVGLKVSIGGAEQTSYMADWGVSSGEFFKVGKIFVNNGKLTLIEEDKKVFAKFDYDSNSDIKIEICAGTTDISTYETIDYAKFIWYPE